MNSIAHAPVYIQTSSQSVPALPTWFGEVTLIVEYLRQQGVLEAITQQVRFARRRFGRYEVLDFVAVLLGYAISGERTIEAFFQVLSPWAKAFMALLDREQLPARSTLSRFLAALPPESVEALRSRFLADLLARRLRPDESLAGLEDRQGNHWLVFDLDGTREAARQRALPVGPEWPEPQRRLRPLCAPGYPGRKRGEVIRTRTTVLQSHTHQWLATFGHAGNGEYRAELRRALEVLQQYGQAHAIPPHRMILRLDGLYGTGAVLADLAGFAFVMRGKEYSVLERPVIQQRLHLPADQSFSHPETPLIRTLYDCPDVPLGPAGERYRVVVATHPASKTKSPVGVERDGVVYELFFTQLPQKAFTAADVLRLYLHRGGFETTLADEDQEQDPDRWCSHTATGQEFWQVLSQWVWNLRLELGHQLDPEPLRTTALAPALEPEEERGYTPAEVALPFKRERFSGHDFVLQSDGTLRCPSGQALHATEQRRESAGSWRLVYAARIRLCRSCSLRESCQWHGATTHKPRRVSVLLHPLDVGLAPLLWRDWSRRRHRRACRQAWSHQQVDVHVVPSALAPPEPQAVLLSRAQRAHYRLSWAERLARNARSSISAQVTIHLFGVADSFAALFG